jgi:hypothetical protein
LRTASIIKGGETGLDERDERFLLGHPVKRAKTSPCKISDMRLDEKLVKHECLCSIIPDEVCHKDARPTVAEVQLAQIHRSKHQGPGCSDQGDEGVIPKMATIVDVSRLNNE